MFQKIFVTGVALVLFFTAAAQTGTKDITLEDIWKNGTFQVKSVSGFTAMKDGERYTQLDIEDGIQEINAYRLSDGKNAGGLYRNTDKAFSVEEYQLSDNEQQILLFADAQNIYRRSVLHHVYLYDVATKKTTPVSADKILNATLSPDGQAVAYVKDNNLYTWNVNTGATKAITLDGRKNSIINGNCDWVYEEEFEFTRAFDWSKDSRYLAFYRFDESKVPTYTLTLYDSLYPTPYTYKYPKAGEPNSVVTIHCYDVKTGETRQMKTIAAGESTDHYIPRIKWTNNAATLCIFKMNRLQNHLEILLANAATGTTQKIYQEDNKRFIEISDNLTFLKDNTSFVFSSEMDGWNHLYRYNYKTKQQTKLTKGDFDVEELTGINEDQGYVYYTAAKNGPFRRELYVTDYTGKGSTQISEGQGFHAITPCDGYRYFLDKFSTINEPPVYRLIDATGAIVRVLEDNTQLKNKMKQYRLGDVKLTRIANGDDEALNGWMMYPPEFDNAKKYPVLMFQYSGPNSQQVLDRFPVADYFWHQMLAEQGYIIACFDGTGTGMRGEDFRKKTYLQLGKLESDDQIAVARGLAAKSYVDPERIGIWGWSFGGFMSATCVFKAPEVFKMGISVAPVTNWRYYDNIYTERYMRTPQENPDGYDNNAPEKLAGKLRGRFLLIHGTGDDNVHVQNSMSLINALIKADKPFDSEFYPNRTHGISGGNTRLQLYRRMTDFVLHNL